MLSICRHSTPDEVSASAERIRSTPDESHMLCIFLPRMNYVPASSVLVGEGERGGDLSRVLGGDESHLASSVNG